MTAKTRTKDPGQDTGPQPKRPHPKNPLRSASVYGTPLFLWLNTPGESRVRRPRLTRGLAERVNFSASAASRAATWSSTSMWSSPAEPLGAVPELANAGEGARSRSHALRRKKGYIE